jgi:hypothetical protein
MIANSLSDLLSDRVGACSEGARWGLTVSRPWYAAHLAAKWGRYRHVAQEVLCSRLEEV